MYITGINGYLSKFEGTEVDAAVERVQGLDSELALKVDKTTKINGISLEGDITLNAEEIGALSENTVYGKFLKWENNILSLEDKDHRVIDNKFIEVDAAKWGKISGDITKQLDLQEEFATKQPLITSENMLSSDLVDDTEHTHKFATAAQLQQIATNTQNISTNAGNIALNTSSINTINGKIPDQASAENQLADKEFVNSSIATNTANFIGTFESVSALEAYTGTVTNNDYAFVINRVVTDNGNDWATLNALNAYDKTLLTNFDYAWVINGTKFDLYRFDIVTQTWDSRALGIDKDSELLNTAYNRYKATVESNVVTWAYEYTLNNSSFTAAQWAAINSGATTTNIGQIAINTQDIAAINLTLGTFGDIVTHDVSEFATAAQGAKADTALQSIDSTMVVNALGYTPEDLANKVTSVSASSTDTQYPSAKLLYDELAKKQDNLTSNNAGDGISIAEVGGVLKISNTRVSAEWGNIVGDIEDQTDLQTALSGKQDTISDLDKYIKNAATGNTSYIIGGTEFSSSTRTVAVGKNAGVSSDGVSVGYSTSSSNNSVSVGSLANGGATYSVAIGYNAKTATNTTRNIQIGEGICSESNKLYIGFGSTLGNYELLDGTTGLIPDARISTNIARTSAIPVIDQTYDGTSTNAQSGVAIEGAGFLRSSNTIAGNRALISDNNGEVASSSITSTKLGYLSDVTSNIQSQINDKASVTIRDWSVS